MKKVLLLAAGLLLAKTGQNAVDPDDRPCFPRWQGRWEDYWKARSEVIRRAPRRRRQMEKEGELLFRSATTMDREAKQVLERAMDLHSARWGRRVHGGSNMQRAQHRRRTHDMAQHFALCGALRLDWLAWKGEVAALVLGARSGDTWFFYWATFDAAAGRYSPGNVLYMRLLEEAFSAGLKIADFMLGATPYKQLWTDEALEITEVLQAGPSPVGKPPFYLLRSARRIKAWYS